MKFKLIRLLLNCGLTALAITFTLTATAQDTIKSTAPLQVSGSADVYYKYDFAGKKASNIPTVFAAESNSISIGMIDLGLKKTAGKATFVGEISFGKRSDESIPNPGYHIQNLYVSYDITQKLNIAGGYMPTFIGYETVLPTGNFNYSTSYLNTNGPFQNAGVRALYTFSDKVTLLAGIFNDYYNVYQSKNDVSTFGAQLMLTPIKDFIIYLNAATGYASGTTLDITTTYQVTSDFKLGLNATNFKSSVYLGTGGYDGVALYPQCQISKTITLGLRGEYYEAKNGQLTLPGPLPGDNVRAITFSANIKAGPLTLIPEVRHDSASAAIFVNGNGAPVKSASQALLAAVYAF